MPKPERPIPALLSDALSQFAKLIGNEFDLAKAELSEKAAQLGRGLAIVAAGAALMMSSLVLLLFATASGLMYAGMTPPIAYALVGGVAAVGAFLLVLTGMGRLSSRTLKPTETLGQLQRDQLAAKEIMK